MEQGSVQQLAGYSVSACIKTGLGWACIWFCLAAQGATSSAASGDAPPPLVTSPLRSSSADQGARRLRAKESSQIRYFDSIAAQVFP